MARSEASCAAGSNPALDRPVGESETMRTVKQRVAKVARGMAPCSSAANPAPARSWWRALHASSQRAAGHWWPSTAAPFRKICWKPSSLAPARFIHWRNRRPCGYFQAAQGGTLFLDEIGDLPLSMQSKLLRAIQERSVRPLAPHKRRRWTCASSAPRTTTWQPPCRPGVSGRTCTIGSTSSKSSFPPLRERKEDLPALCQALLERIARESHSPVARLTSAALAAIASYPLPGNVRELENLLHRAVA